MELAYLRKNDLLQIKKALVLLVETLKIYINNATELKTIVALAGLSNFSLSFEQNKELIQNEINYCEKLIQLIEIEIKSK